MENAMTVAGVTFANPDGTQRQDILKHFGNECFITVNLIKQTFSNAKTGENEPAIACIEKVTKQQLGFISRNDLNRPEVTNVRQLTGQVRCFQNENNQTTFYCEIAPVQAPDSEMYANMKKLCAANNLTLPAYDVRAYEQFITWFENRQATATVTANSRK